MLEIKKEFNIGDKVIVCGWHCGARFKHEIGEIVYICDQGKVGIEFENTQGGLHTSPKTYRSNSYAEIYSDRIHIIRTYDFTEKTLKELKEEFKDRYSTKIIRKTVEEFCRIESCSNCPMRVFNSTIGCDIDLIYYAENLYYNSFVNLAKDKLEREEKRLNVKS